MKTDLGWYRIRGRSRGSLAVSIGIHLAVAIALLNIVFRYPIGRFVEERPSPSAPERLRYVRVAPAPSAGGDSTAGPRASTGPVATRRLRAPTRVPVGIPEPAPATAAAAPGVEDRAGGAGRPGDVTPGTGVQPAYDPRLWPQPGPFTPLPKTMAERTDSAVKAAFGVYADSVRVAEANQGRAPGDWTLKDKNGRKWGWDPSGIRLGKVTIPQAVLALLPLNVQQNPMYNDPVIRREVAYRSGDIAFHANRAVSDDEFRRAVKRIRERKDRERAAERTPKANDGEPQPAVIPGKDQR